MDKVYSTDIDKIIAPCYYPSGPILHSLYLYVVYDTPCSGRHIGISLVVSINAVSMGEWNLSCICWSLCFNTETKPPSFDWRYMFVTYSISQEICIRFCFAVLCCGYTLTDFPICIRLTSLALWQSNDCPSASKATLMNMDKYFMWIHYERLNNHNKAKHNKTVFIFLGIYCISTIGLPTLHPCYYKPNLYWIHVYGFRCGKWGGTCGMLDNHKQNKTINPMNMSSWNNGINAHHSKIVLCSIVKVYIGW